MKNEKSPSALPTPAGGPLERGYKTKQEDYTMKGNKKQRESFIDLIGGKKNAIAMAIFAIVALGGGIAAMMIEGHQMREAQYIDSWPITINQHVELTYAGKGGQ